MGSSKKAKIKTIKVIHGNFYLKNYTCINCLSMYDTFTITPHELSSFKWNEERVFVCSPDCGPKGYNYYGKTNYSNM